METLILLTKKFPLEKGETFLKNEIEYLSNSFKKVIIFSCSVKKKSKPLLLLPSNVEVIGVSSRNTADLIKILIKIPFYMFLKEDKTRVKGELKRRLFRAYFYSSSKLIYKKIINKLRIFNFTNEKLYFYSYWMYDISLVAIWLQKYYSLSNVTSCFTRAHGYDLYEYRNKMNYIPYREYIMNNINEIYCCSKDGEKYLKNIYSLYIDKINFSYLGTNDYGNKNYSQSNIIVSCSNVISLKRIDLIIESLAILQKKNIDFMWYHIGNGNLFGEIYNYANSLLNKENFKFLGYLNNDKVIDFYLNNDIRLFINTSSSEGLPVSIMEAISFGIPVIATDVGGTSEIVIDNITGKLISSNPSNKEISMNIERMLLLNSDYYMSIRKSTRRYWEENFYSNDNYIKFINTIKNINEE